MTRKPPRENKRDVVTLADLAPRHRVSGGSDRRVFGSDAPVKREEAERAMPKSTKKDLPVKSTVKGGKLIGNDNLTLVRAAKPVTRDLPAGKPIKGGKKAR